MSETIKLSPEMLISQAAQLSTLSNDFNNLFDSVVSELNTINGNWSKNLANNFAGKIVSAQNGFRSVVDALNNGSEAARICAESFENIDDVLAKMMSGGGSNSSAGATITGGNAISGSVDIIEAVKNELGKIPEQIKTAGEALKYLEDKYGELPEEAKVIIDAVVPKGLKTAYQITSDLLQGEFDLDNVMSAIKYVAGSSLEVSAVISAIDYTLDKGKDYLNKAQDKATQNIMEGDLLGASANAFEGFVDTVGGGVATVAGDLIGGAIDKTIGKIPGISTAIKLWTGGKSIGSYIEDGAAYVADGIDKATDIITDGINVVTDGFTKGVQKVGNWFCGLIGF